jgi:CDP-glycerol glycerophosphotransferase (TagB/SpsB family)
LHWFDKNSPVVCYCAEPLDYLIFESIQPYLKKIPITGKRKTRLFLKKRGFACKRMPCFPKAAIMFRHATYKFPEKKILKIGLRHGVYTFKKHTHADNYNEFALYLTTSRTDVKIAESLGCKTVYSVGYPRIDPLFNGTYNSSTLEEYREKAKLNPAKKTILFTTTYNASGLSAIDIWINKLNLLLDKYNILVTVHPWVDNKYKRKLKNEKGIYFIKDVNTLPFLAIADIMVSDYSSIIGEFCALDKPIVTFKVRPGKRTTQEIMDLIEKISIQVSSFDEMIVAIEQSLKNSDEMSSARQEANTLMFDALDGKSGQRAAEQICKYLPDLRLVHE